MTALTLYGIPTCDTCKKAIRALQGAGHEVTFRDVRATPLTDAEIDVITGEFGDRVVNKQSTSYRAFSDFLRASDPEDQIRAQPTVMKRPVIHDGTRWYLGWDEAVQAAFL